MNRIRDIFAFKMLWGIYIGLLIISLQGCIRSEVDDVPPTRTILFYIATDNNGLDNGSTGDEPKDAINAIRAGWKPGRGEMLIYTDQTNRRPCLMRINNTRNEDGLYGIDTVWVSPQEENSADAEVLKRVINKVVNDYPADSYGMLFFSHSSGWLPKGMLNAPRSSEMGQQLSEQSSGDAIEQRSLVIDKGEILGGEVQIQEMEYYDFAVAIPDKQFDFIIFESCLMADVMSMYELRNKTEYVLASSAEIVSPGLTFIYKDNIMRLYDTRIPVASAVEGFANSYVTYIKTYFREDDVYCSTTMGLIKMSEMQNLAKTVKEALNGTPLNESTLTVDSIQRFDRPDKLIGVIYPKRSRYFDLDHTIENVASASQYAAFRTQLEKTVVWKDNTKRFLLANYSNGSPNYVQYNGFFIKRHSGLTTYIQQSVFDALNKTYENSSWYKAIY